MELVQHELKNKVTGTTIVHQFYEDFDFNVPDAKEDVKEIIEGHGVLRIEGSRRIDNYIEVKGKLYYQVLCMLQTEGQTLTSLTGTFPIEELIFVNELEDDGWMMQTTCNRVEINPQLIHSRKVNIKVQMELLIKPEKMISLDITKDALPEEVYSSSEEYTLHKRYVPVNALTIRVHNQDTYRIKEEVKLAGTKENIGEIILTDIPGYHMETKAVDDEILLSGEVQIFVMYNGEDGGNDWIEESVHFEGRIPCYGLEEGMLHRVIAALSDEVIEPRMDEDGELRILGVEVTLNMHIEVYQEEEFEVLEDAYSCEKKCSITRAKMPLESLALSNQSRCKLSERISVPELGDEVLQICHSQGNLQVENVNVTDDGLLVEGILHTHFLYMRVSDEKPYGIWQGMIPFTHTVSAEHLAADVVYDMDSTLAQLSIAMTGSDEIEIKALLEFDCLIRQPYHMECISNIEVGDYEREEQELSAGIIGYIVKEGDDLWDLAKRYHTTEEGIMEVNNLSEKGLRPGEKILLFKENVSIL